MQKASSVRFSQFPPHHIFLREVRPLRQFASALLQQVPSFAVGFVAITDLLHWRQDRTQHPKADSRRAQQQRCRDQIPGILWNNVSGKQVKLFQRVVFFLMKMRLESTRITRTLSAASGLDLHAKKVLAVFDADVVGARVSPGLADGEAALGSLAHELQLDPFAALFEAGEAFPVFHFSPDFFCYEL